MTRLPSTNEPAMAQSSNPDRSKLKRWGVLVTALTVIAMCFWMFGSELDLAKLAAREAAFRQYRAENPAMIYVVAFAIYVAVTGLSLPGATAMTLIIGWLFGVWRGVILVSFGSTTGATVAFLFSRFLLRKSIEEHFGDRLRVFNEALQRDGAFYLFTLRLIPAVPFFVINAVMGLTPISVRTFWWISQLGMLPGTIVYVYAGSSVPNLQTLADHGVHAIFAREQMTQLAVAFVLLGLFPLAVRILMKRFVGRPRLRKGVRNQ